MYRTWLVAVLTMLVATGLYADALRAAVFSKELVAGDIRFQVAGIQDGRGNRVRLTAAGPGIDSTPVTVAVNGTVTWAEVTDDLDNDGLPELYVYAACPDTSDPFDTAHQSDPDVLVAVTPRGHGGAVVPIVPVVPTRGAASGAVVIGPGVTRQTADGTVHVLPVQPIEDQTAGDICVDELKFILVSGKRGKIPRLAPAH